MSKGTNKIGARGIRIGDCEALRQAFDTVNGNASSFTLRAHDAVSRAEIAERRLEVAGIPMSRRVGCIADVKGSGPSARTYKYSVATTDFMMRRFADGWRVMSIERAVVKPKFVGGMTIRIPEGEADRIKLRAANDAMAGFTAVAA